MKQRSAATLAEFEQKSFSLPDFGTNDVWKAAGDAVIEAANRANEEIDAESTLLGIPEEFRSSVRFISDRRGQVEYEGCRDDLRKVAKAEIDALEEVASVQIGAERVKAQAEINANGPASDDAVGFLERLPDVERTMSAFDAAEIRRKLADRARRKGGRGGFCPVGDRTIPSIEEST